MTEYISREAAVRAIDVPNIYHGIIAPLQEILCEIPAADVAPVVHAEWKINADGYYPYCSACKKEPPGRCMTAHCPHCGARMDLGKDGEQDG